MAGWQWLEWSRRLWIRWMDTEMWASPAMHVPQLALQVAAQQQERRDRKVLPVASQPQAVSRQATVQGFRGRCPSDTTTYAHPYREAAQTVLLK